MHIIYRRRSERARARMNALSVLPVFFDLQGRRVAVAGGSDAAAWKAELLAAAGAEVHVYAPAEEVGEEMARLLAAAGACGSYVHHEEAWRADGLAGATLAVADVPTEREAHAFATAAGHAGVPCNVVDRPAHCRFQFGSIVNRSPVVVGISTSGASPILAQAVRRRIETLLPPSLVEWGALAGRLRGAVAARLACRRRRRAFWEAYAERAFGPAPDLTGTEDIVREIAEAASCGAAAGGVVFVGAGPGDPELLTLKAVRALQRADVVLFDAEISDEVLDLARREAKRIAAESEGAGALATALARAGRRVVRLVVGNPAARARAAAEIVRLRRAGVHVEFVPAVAAAAPSQAGESRPKIGYSLRRQAMEGSDDLDEAGTTRRALRGSRADNGGRRAGGLPR